MKPRVFIGSSIESISIAYAIQENLERVAEVTVWDQGIFEPSSYNLDILVKALSKYDFGIFVFSTDDIVKIRDKEYLATRDNVLFELGLFIGRFGREKIFIVTPEGLRDFRLPTDLLGLTLLGFNADRQDQNLRAALGPSCNRISQVIQKFEIENSMEIVAQQPRGQDLSSHISIDLPEFIVLGENMGIPQIVFFLGLINTGQTTESISKINLFLRHENGLKINLRARTYISRQLPNQPGLNPPEYPIIRISLRPGESWVENVRCFMLRSEEEQEKINKLVREAQKNISEKRKGLTDLNTWVELDQDIYDRAVSIFDENFKRVFEGKYHGIVAALSSESDLEAVKGFEFDISKEALLTLSETVKDGYKYGAGIFFPNNQAFNWCRIYPVEDDAAKKIYEMFELNPDD